MKLCSGTKIGNERKPMIRHEGLIDYYLLSESQLRYQHPPNHNLLIHRHTPIEPARASGASFNKKTQLAYFLSK